MKGLFLHSWPIFSHFHCMFKWFHKCGKKTNPYILVPFFGLKEEVRFKMKTKDHNFNDTNYKEEGKIVFTPNV